MRMMFKYLKFSAPGKIILCGEHSVVYGKKALACSINLRTFITAEYILDKSLVRFDFKNFESEIKMKNFQITQSEFNEFRKERKAKEQILDDLKKSNSNQKHFDSIKFLIKSLDSLEWSNLGGLNVKIESDIPLGSGLGSSASFSVCLASLFLYLSKELKISEEDFKNNKFRDEELKKINDYAFDLEKIFHGNPSGIDNTVSTFGQFVLYQKNEKVEKFASAIEDFKVLIVNSGVPKQTKEQVEKVKKLHEKHENILDNLMNTIDVLVKKFADILKQKNEKNKLDELNDLITINQGLLYSLQVSTPTLNEITNLISKHGFHSKITGAGGGGCLFALVNKDSEKLKDELKAHDFKLFEVGLGCEGILVEEILFDYC